MNLKIERSTLHRLVQSVLPAIGTKTPIDALRCIRVEAVEKGIILSATDLNISLHAMSSADVTDPGLLGITAKPLADVASSLDEGVVQIFTSPVSNHVQLKTERAACHLGTIAGDQYPMIPNYNQMEFKEIPSNFFDLIERVKFCTSKEENNKPHLTGIYFSDKEMAAVDGYRLAAITHNLDIPKPLLVPSASLDRVRKSLSGDKLYMAVGNSEIHLQSNNCIATIRLLEGAFPDYSKVIPQGPYDTAVIQRESLIKAVRFVMNLADTMNRVRLEFKPGKLKLFSNSPDGDAEDIIECQCDMEFKSHVNAKFLLQGLENLTKDTVTFELRPGKPLVTREEGYVQVLMPQRD